MTTKTRTKLRAVGYSRTSGEGQRDNTSIPRQKSDIEKFIKSNKWQFVRHYVDESLTGSKIEGRKEFQQMLRDAANDKFDVVIIFDIDRFARDGSDVLSTSSFLKKNYGIDVIDVKANFDTRDHQKVLMRFVHAGLAEDEKLRIINRTVNARIENAKDGFQWSPKPPFGRAFKKSGKRSGTWYLTEDGKTFRALLKRYVEGETLRHLATKFGCKSVQTITQRVRESQLSAGTYLAKFHSPKIGIENLVVPIPNFPAVISPGLEKRVRDRMGWNKTNNKQARRKYLLGGFVTCAHCGKPLHGQTNCGVYYRHTNTSKDKGKKCLHYRSIRADILEGHVLTYLYAFFLDKVAYIKAVKAALPSNNDRKAIEQDISTASKEVSRTDRQIANLVNAIADGADVALLLDKQSELKARKQALENRFGELKQTLIAMPDPEVVKEQSLLLRSRMLVEHVVKDWRTLPYEDVRQFLHFLFSDNPRKNGYGILVALKKSKWYISFKGCVDFPLGIITDQESSKEFEAEVKRINAETGRIFQRGVSQAKKAYNQKVKPSKHYKY